MAGDITSKASGHWDKLENIFEDRVAKALNKLGVPSAKDVNALIARIDELNKSVQRLSSKDAAAGKVEPLKAVRKTTATTRKAKAAKPVVAVPAPVAQETSAAPNPAASAKKAVVKRARKATST